MKNVQTLIEDVLYKEFKMSADTAGRSIRSHLRYIMQEYLKERRRNEGK